MPPEKRQQKPVRVSLAPGGPVQKMPLGHALNQASALKQRGDLAGAEWLLRELVKQAPKAEQPRGMLGETLLGRNLPLRARKVLSPVVRGAEEAGTLLIAARLLKRLLRLEDARSYIEKALRLERGRVDALFELAVCEMELGNEEASEGLIDKLLVKQPDLTSTYWLRAQLDLREKDDEHLAQMETVLKESSFSKRDRVSLQYSCARILQRRGDVEGEFRYLDEASATILSQRPWKPQESQRSHERIHAMVEQGMSAFEGASGPGSNRVPLLVTSMPRSGSTLLERILGTHPEVSPCGEWGFVPAWSAEQLRDRPGAQTDELWSGSADLAELVPTLTEYVEAVLEALRVESAFFTEKSITNFEYLPFLLLAFPKAKVLHIQRDPLDAALSAYQVHFGFAHGYTYDLRAFAVRYRQHLEFMDAWRALFPDRILTVQYEDLARQPEETLRPVLEFCGLPWDPAVLRFHESKGAVLTASMMQVRRPMNTASVGKHKRYGKLLAPAAEELGIGLG